MSAHTPGPWVVLRNAYPHYIGGYHIELTIFTEWKHPQSKQRVPVACTSQGIGRNQGDPNMHFTSISEADARVMAAAPELLAYAQCEDALSRGEDIAEPVLRKHGWDDSKGSVKEFLDQMRRAAIAKAVVT